MEEEVKTRTDLTKLKATTDQRIEYLSSKASLEDSEVYLLIKDFFKELLELDYEFSYEELLDELDKTYIDNAIHDRIITLVTAIGKIEYDSDAKYSETQLKKMLIELQRIAHDLIHDEKNKTSSFTLFKKTTKKEETLGDLIEQIRLESKPDKAKEIYKKALEKYNAMSEEDKEVYYQKLMEVYTQLKTFSTQTS